jgi:hypothetical protein
MTVDPGLMMALSVHAHKGVYAVLLGSGVSRSAGIPTGWDVVKNLIERLAAVRGVAKVEDAEAWYRKEFSKEPSYSDLIELLAPTPPERMSLLKDFFEPTEKERDEGLKVPTAAHRAIAHLVARGYVRVIVTTNFDKLMERAIEAEGVTPTIVSSVDGITGMMPLPHVRCLVMKVHGDYLDTRIRNTPAELAAYDVETNTLLDRIFSEYGLIVCGWSGDWDPALAEAIRRSTRHRFSTYWMLRGKLSDRAAELVKHRQAALIPIETADKAFADLDARVAGQHLIAFKDRFCRAVAEGLPLTSIGSSVYCGSVPFVAERDCPNLPDARSRALDLVVHRFRNELTGDRELVYLPPSARLRVQIGEALEQGHIWCDVLAEKPDAQWCEQDRLIRWNSLDAVLGGAGYVGLLQRVWFDHQSVMCNELGSGQMLMPADLVSLGARNLSPLGLLWDFARCQEFIDQAASAVIFPSLRLHQWNHLRFSLPGDVAMNGSIAESLVLRSSAAVRVIVNHAL